MTPTDEGLSTSDTVKLTIGISTRADETDKPGRLERHGGPPLGEALSPVVHEYHRLPDKSVNGIEPPGPQKTPQAILPAWMRPLIQARRP